MTTTDDKTMRSFDTGATRDTAEGKLLYDKFLCPTVLKQFAKFMNMNRLQSDGQLRDGDNWQKGIPMKLYLECLGRHYHEFWTASRDSHHTRTELIGAACGIMFNVMGYLHEWLKVNTMVDFDGDEPTDEMRARKERVESMTATEPMVNYLQAWNNTFNNEPELDPCLCGCGRDDGECDGMASANTDDVPEGYPTGGELQDAMDAFEQYDTTEVFCEDCVSYELGSGEEPCLRCDDECSGFEAITPPEEPIVELINEVTCADCWHQDVRLNCQPCISCEFGSKFISVSK